MSRFALLLGFLVLTPHAVSAAQQGVRRAGTWSRIFAKRDASNPGPTGHQVSQPTARPSTNPSESAAAKRVDAVQQQIQREASNLQARLTKLNKLRQAALQKGDDKQLQRIEQLERKTVQAYEQRVNGLISGLSVAPTATRQPQTQPRKPRTAAPGQGTSGKPKPTSKRRVRFWPFSR